MSPLSESLAAGLEQAGTGLDTGAQQPWLAALRQRGRQIFRGHGLPGKDVERWKYTSLQELEKRSPKLVDSPAAGLSDAGPEPLCGAAIRLSLVDGRWVRLHGELPPGVTLQPLEVALGQAEELLREMLQGLEIEDRAAGFSALNTADLRHGWFLHVADGVDAGRLLVQWSASAAAGESMANSRACVLLGPGARLDWVEQFESGVPAASQLNMVSQVRLGEGACLRHVRLQQAGAQAILITSSTIEQAGGSEYEYTGLDFGGGLVRHDVRARLQGQRASCKLHGACLTRGRAHVDNHLDAEHLVGDCASGQVFRAVLAERSRVVFNGRVFVAPGADGTEARQSSAGLLLSTQAELDSKPELEIYADEVVASHGATIGQLEADQLFYLQSRGLSLETARNLLTTAFCRSVIEPVPAEDLRDALQTRLQSCLAEAGIG